MVDEQDGGLEAALDIAQEAEDGGDLGDGVLVDAVQADQGVEDDEAGPDTFHGLQQALPVVAMVEAQDGDVDDGDVEGLERGAGGPGDALETGAHDMAGVLGGEQQDRPGPFGGEVAQAGDAGGHRDGEIEREEGFAALGFAADDADRVAAPEPVDQPLPVPWPVLELGRGSGREALHRRALLGWTGSPDVSMKSKKLTARLAKFRALGATLSRLPFDEAAHLRNVLRRLRRQKTTIDRLRKENARLRKAVTAAKAGREGAEARLARLRAARKTLSKKLSGMDAELRKVLRRSRRQKSAIKSLSRENGRLRKAVKGSQRRVETLETQLARLRSTGAVLSRKLFGRKSEQQDKPRSERKRGQQRGAPGHGRTQRPGLEERAEVHNPPPDACICACCGQPYAPNGVEESTLVEIEVKAHKRVISRPRLRRTCECASSPMEVSAPPAPRLFDDTLYGITVWTCFLYERYACFRPLNAVAAWLRDRGLAISPGTLADSVKRFLPLFEPIAKAILAHQNMATVRHADETSWRVQEFRREDRSSRAWLWTSVSSDAVYYRGRDAGCPAPPAQIRTGPLGHPAPPLGSAPHSADGKSLVRPRVSDFQLGPMGLGQCRDIGPCRAVLLRP